MSSKHLPNNGDLSDLEKGKQNPFQDIRDANQTEPAPPYPADSQTIEQQQQLHDQSLSTSPAYPLQPHHTPIPIRTLQTKYTDWKGNRILIREGDSPTPLYSIKIKMTKPHMLFKSAHDDGPTVGETSFHALSSRIDTLIHGNPITLTAKGLLKKLKCDYSFDSIARPGSTLTWRYAKSGSEFRCVDELGMPIVRFGFSPINYGRAGRMEIFAPDMAAGRGMDEMVVSGVSLAHLVLFLTLAVI